MTKKIKKKEVNNHKKFSYSTSITYTKIWYNASKFPTVFNLCIPKHEEQDPLISWKKKKVGHQNFATCKHLFFVYHSKAFFPV